MQLVELYPDEYSEPPIAAIHFLWKMLADRDPVVNISHNKMPSWNEHCAFVVSHPYQAWYIIEHNDEWVGNCYLTKANEIGIHMLPEYQGKAYGYKAVQKLMELHGPGRYLANVSNFNITSQEFFKKLGFKLIQFTYEFEHDQD